MKKFAEYTFESTTQDYYISFIYNDELISFESTIFRKIYTDTIHWLYTHGYKFDETVVGRKLFKKSDIPQTYQGKGLVYDIPNTNYAIIVNVGNPQSISNLIKMLTRFGINPDTIKTYLNKTDKIKTFKKSSNGMSFVDAAIQILKDANTPLTSNKIWEESADLVKTSGLTPESSMKTILLKYCDNSSVASGYKTKYFHIIGDNPMTYWLIDRMDELQDIDQEPEDSTEETIDVLVNPFQQSICVLGESGSGKSVTIENILENEVHEFEFIIPSATTTNLLAQFSPSKSGYVPSRLGKMIIAAAQNPDKLYTAVFDEMHKSSVISMINDELLQCISTKRNNGVRFISLDDDTSELYNIDDLEKSRGNIILPENFGFIFISSKPKVISNNPDFFNRVDIVILKHHDEETIDSSDELLDKVLDEVEKAKLASNRND